VDMIETAKNFGVEIRAGLHTGEIELRGDDIGGLAVHIAARVSALAGANEVLATGTVRDLVVGSGLAFNDRGRHDLKGVPGEWQLLAVDPARSLD
jgi:class 3 adenylate cyclase